VEAAPYERKLDLLFAIGANDVEDCYLAGRNIRGILTPVCALAQNDRLVSTPSEFQPWTTEENRHGTDTGGTPGSE